MSIKDRLTRLEREASAPADAIVVLWRSLTRREDDRLVETLASAIVLPSATAPGETFERHPSDGEEAFIRHVTDAACRIHGRSDPEFAAELWWHPTTPAAGTHSTVPLISYTPEPDQERRHGRR